MVQINEYRQTTTPQGALVQPRAQSSGIGEAVAGVARAAGQAAGQAIQAQERRDERKARTWFAETAPSMQSELLALRQKALDEGPEDGDGITGRWLDEAEKVMQAYAKAAPNARAQEMLKIQGGEWLIQQKDRLVAEEFQRGQKYVATAFARGVDESAKVIAQDPAEFGSMVQQWEFSLSQSDLPNDVKAELRADARLKMAGAAVSAQIQADPASWIASDKSKDLPWNLLPKDAQDKFMAQAEQEVYVRQQRAEAAVAKEQKQLKDAAYNAATEAALSGQSFTPPAGLDPYEAQQAREYYTRLVEQQAYQAKGGSLTTDQEYYDQVLAAMSGEDKTPFLGMNIDRTRLSERDFRTFNNAQIRMREGRSTATADVSPYVKRAMTKAGIDKGPKAKAREQAWTMAMLDAVSQQEEALNRPLNQKELQDIADQTFLSVTETERLGGLHTSRTPTIREVDPAIAPIISGWLKDTPTEITPAAILELQRSIEEPDMQRALDAALEEQGKPPTKQNRAILYGEVYKAQFGQ